MTTDMSFALGRAFHAAISVDNTASQLSSTNVHAEAALCHACIVYGHTPLTANPHHKVQAW